MARKLILKNALRENRLFKDRVILAWLIAVLLTLGLLSRLFFLQVMNHEHYTTLSEKNRLKILPLPPTRGLIYDRNGVVVAENQPAFSLEIIPEQLIEKQDEVIAELGKLIDIGETDIARFYRFRKQKRRFDNVLLRSRLTEKEVAVLAVELHRFPGVVINSSLERYYPLGARGAHAIGYVGRINERELKQIDTTNYSGSKYIGKIGVEKYYEAELHGQVGFQEVETNVRGRVLRVIKRELPVPGKNLRLHLDMELQGFTEHLLENKRGAIVAIEPETGGVLALASMPTYDPNLFVNGIDHKTYQALRDSPDRPLYNRALRGQYPPGSTIKPIVGLAGLEYGLRSPHSRTWCPGWYRLPNQEHKYRDWKRSGHGWVDLKQAVAESCDVYFYDLAHDLGIDRLSSFMQRFGFGARTGIDVSGELGGLMPTREWKRRRRGRVWYPGETLITGIGQGFMMATPLQLAVATAALSRRGQIRRPRLVFLLESATGDFIQTIPSLSDSQITLHYDEYWDEAIASMVEVVHGARGTARRIGFDSPYRIAGKTGTAQVIGIKQNERYDKDKIAKRFHDHALFVSFAPVENPQIAVSVIIENGGSGSSAAAPLARRVMDYYLRPERRKALVEELLAEKAAAEEARHGD